MTSAEIESRVTNTASFLDVPASRKEWASTRAPVLRSQCHQDQPVQTAVATAVANGGARRTREIIIAE